MDGVDRGGKKSRRLRATLVFDSLQSGDGVMENLSTFSKLAKINRKQGERGDLKIQRLVSLGRELRRARPLGGGGAQSLLRALAGETARGWPGGS